MDKPFAAYKGDEPYVFVCYAHDDDEVVYPELGWVHEQGINLWYDEGIAAGRIWRAEIAEVIDGTTKVLFYISRASLASDHCRREIHYALDKGCEIVPVYLEEVELTGDLQIGLNLVQALHRHRDASYHQHLLSALGEPAEANYPIPATSDMPAIAVLPFANMSADADNEYFSDGISEEILNGLANLSGIKVIARTSSFSFREERDIREIGRLLGVSHVLEGSVRKSGSRVRITAQLIDARDGSQLWSESYNRELRDVFAVQDAIGRSILGKLEVTLFGGQGPPKRQVDPEAYDAYLLGKYHYSFFRPNRAIESYQRSIEIEPDFADAYGALARVHNFLLINSAPRPRELRDAVQRYVTRALELDPNQPVALAAHAAKLFFADGEYQSALDIFHDLLKRFPNNDAVVSNAGNPLSAIGRHDLALRLYQMRVELDPLSPRTHTGVGQQLFFLGRFAEAEKAFTRSRALGGRVYPWSVSAAMYQGDSEGAERYLEMVMADWPDLPWMGHMAAIDLANIEGDMVRAGHHAHSLIDLAKTTFVPEGPKSVAYYVLGDASWVTALSQSLADREYVTLLLLRVPSVPKLSQEPEYQELLRSVGLDDESVAELHVQEWPL